MSFPADCNFLSLTRLGISFHLGSYSIRIGFELLFLDMSNDVMLTQTNIPHADVRTCLVRNVVHLEHVLQNK